MIKIKSKIIALAVIASLFCLTSCQVFAEEKIIYSSLVGNFWQIFIMDSNGENKTQLTKSSTDKRYPVYLENMDKILYRTNNNEFFLIDINGGNEKRILENMGSLTGSDYCPITEKLVFTRFREDSIDNANLWISSLQGKNAEMLTNKWGLQYNPAFSADGKRIVYVSGCGFGTHEIFIMNLKDKNIIQLTNDKALDFSPAFSPDGKKIIYVSDISGNYEIWVMNSNGKNKIKLTDNETIDTKPCWLHNGKEIVFTSARTGRLQIWKMNADGTNAVQLTFKSESCDPCLAGKM